MSAIAIVSVDDKITDNHIVTFVRIRGDLWKLDITVNN